MKTVFQLCFVTSVRQLTPILMLVLVAVLPFAFTEFTNYNVDPDVAAPARMQAAWQVAWVVGLFWSLFNSAHASSHVVQSRIGEYFKSLGVPGGSQLLGIWASTMVYVLVITLIPMLITVFSIQEANELKHSHWVALSFQHFAFMILTFTGVNYLAAAFGSRFGATIGYVSPLILSLAGIYFVPLLKKLVAGSDFFVLDVVYSVLPHYYLADLTHRFVHQQGALGLTEFLSVFEYLAGWAILLSVISNLIFTPKEK